MNTATRIMRLAVGQARVTGHYHAAQIVGVVESSRQLSWPPDYPEQVTIKLDTPLDPREWGADRTHVLINSRELDQSPQYFSLQEVT